MNWDAVGAIAELVGAGAVVLTLIYLAIQLRHNTQAVRGESERGTLEDGNSWMYKLIENPEIAELYRKGLRGGELSSNDRLRFRLLMGTLVGHWNHAFRVGAANIVQNSEIPGVLSTRGGAVYWRQSLERNERYYDEDFVEYMNEVLKEVEQNA
ncbi:MAG: hypothetical protein ACI82A_001612 [Candidatus Azotimanducaceae bacterium]|jgi:hypothetical protein